MTDVRDLNRGCRRPTRGSAGGAMPAAALALAAAGLGAVAAEGGGTAVMRADSRAPFVHVVAIADENGASIKPDDGQALPYSPKMTCGKCHDYSSISGGWHFSSMGEPQVGVATRPGQPWVLADPKTMTQLPLSYRGWPGTFRPDDAGLTPWQFVMTFGRHVPGGDAGERGVKLPDPKARWPIAGPLEIDCLACHSTDSHYDQTERASQISRENLKWVPTATARLGAVRGAASKVPDDFDPLAPPNPDHPEWALPTTLYDKARFDADDRVFLGVTRRPAAERCYFCHTHRPAGRTATPEWQREQDVHLASGLTCVDCHRNGINHRISRGIEGDRQPHMAGLTCRGCHYGEVKGMRVADRGRLGAPMPRHTGLPGFHLDRLSCTVCHSGPIPGGEAGQVQTAQAHGLGIARKELHEDALPLIAEPVLMVRDGVVTPNRMMWPAFWARMGKDQDQPDRIVPLAPTAVAKLVVRQAAAAPAEGQAAPASGHAGGAWTALTEADVAATLAALAEAGPHEGEPVYVSGGNLWRRTADGKVTAAAHPAAAPYAWPVAHDVRPVQQSLGATGCVECHARQAAFFAGTVRPTPAVAGGADQRLSEFLQSDPCLMAAWSTVLALRLPTIAVCLLAAGALTALLVHYACLGLAGWPRGPR